ncbi:MAG: site-specific DNA-methyltransferase [Dehalococcoidia bacterium]|nr:site-specific DNA-methyltransferase [Dehalococcoidia bacterium]
MSTGSLTPDDDYQVIVGDAALELSQFPDAFFQSCITSPPYWGVRDYGIQGQIGAEGSLGDYIDHLRMVFHEIRRVLRDDGTLWLNIGDTYTSGNRTWRAPDRKNPARAMKYRPPTPVGLKPKDLVGVPWRLAFSLQEDGWYLRSDIIWYKPNVRPESVKDRPTQSHEYVFMLSKSDRYYYNHKAGMEPTTDRNALRHGRTLWTIPTKPNRSSHFAMFPPSLVKRCIDLGSQPGDRIIDPFCGSGTVGLVCLETNRRFAGIEIKPEYAALALSRTPWAGGQPAH